MPVSGPPDPAAIRAAALGHGCNAARVVIGWLHDYVQDAVYVMKEVASHIESGREMPPGCEVHTRLIEIVDEYSYDEEGFLQRPRSDPPQ